MEFRLLQHAYRKTLFFFKAVYFSIFILAFSITLHANLCKNIFQKNSQIKYKNGSLFYDNILITDDSNFTLPRVLSTLKIDDNLINDIHNKRILSVGEGPGNLFNYFKQRNITVKAMDPIYSEIDNIRQMPETEVGNKIIHLVDSYPHDIIGKSILNNLDEKFDLIVSHALFWHLNFNSSIIGLSNLLTNLNPEGKILIVTNHESAQFLSEIVADQAPDLIVHKHNLLSTNDNDLGKTGNLVEITNPKGRAVNLTMPTSQFVADIFYGGSYNIHDLSRFLNDCPFSAEDIDLLWKNVRSSSENNKQRYYQNGFPSPIEKLTWED